ncbi:MAG: beta-ketoacyl-[acyl-carrier-protein] synthase family protein [Alphaproteobacteria bacterium]|nr:beta-ketoacyl-[acyl-carrier-protein] synthase family protein [Alphaproteobacteria bacterium]
MKRVVITGIGVTAPSGCDLESFWDSLITGRNIFAESRDLPGSGILVGAIDAGKKFDGLPLHSLSPCDRNGILAVSAAQSALRHAGLDGAFENPERVAVVIGNGFGGVVCRDSEYERLYKENRRNAHPFTVVRVMASSSASWISLAFGTRGPSFVTSSAGASATQAIGTAAQLVRSGAADIAVTGGTEAPLSIGITLAWATSGIMSRRKCAPFSRYRDGILISEGAAILILESDEHASRRGAVPLAEIGGFASNVDGIGIGEPTASGMARAMCAAIADAGLCTGDISYVSAHGTGTRASDCHESEALRMVFGDRPPPVSSIKGTTGHTLGASGAIQAVATILAMARSIAPPTANFEEVDPDCNIDVIPNHPRAMPISVALSNSFALGGLNASLVIKQVH